MLKSIMILFMLFLCFFSKNGNAQTNEFLDTNLRVKSVEIENRIHFIQSALHDEAKRAKTWTYSWHGTFAGFTTGQAIAIPFLSNNDRIDMYYGIGGDVIGHLALLFLPLKSMQDSRDLNRLIQETNAGLQSPEVLKKAEFYLRHSATDEVLIRNWKVHTGNALFNVGLGLMLGLVHGRWVSAGLFMGSGIAIGEILILTQPHRLPQQWKHYQKGQYKFIQKNSYLNWRLSPILSSKVYGAGIAFRF